MPLGPIANACGFGVRRRVLLRGLGTLVAAALLPEASAAWPRRGASGGGGGVTTAWDTSSAYDANFTFALSNRQVTRIAANSAGNMIKASKGITSGKPFWEVTVNSHVATNDCGFGVADTAAPIGVNGFSNYVGGAAGSAGYFLNGGQFANGSSGLGLPAGFADGETAVVGFDYANKEIHVFIPSVGTWDRAGTASPVAGNGQVISAAITTVYPVATCDEFGPPGDSLTINTGAVSFVNTAAVAAAIAAGYTQLG